MIHVYKKNISIGYKGGIYIAKIVAEKHKDGKVYLYCKWHDEEGLQQDVSFLVERQGEYHMLIEAGIPHRINKRFTDIDGEPLNA